jgi:pilus assembly protein CpaE
VCAAGTRLDINLLESGALRVSPNFSLLAASDNPDPVEEIRPENFDSVLQLARRHFEFIVIDMGRQVNTVSIRALDSSDLIFPVLQQSLPYLRNARRLLDIFSSLGYRRDKIQLTLNRHENSAAVTLAELERVLDLRVAYRVPNNYDIVNDSINQGVPVLQLARSSSVSKSLAEWVNRLVDSNAPSAGSIIRRIFVRNTTGQATH